MPGLYACGEMLGSLCAAIAAREAGADVCLLERAPEALRGGNSAFTAGLMRTVYDDVGDVLRLVDSLTDADLARTDLGSYTADDFLDTLARITEYRCDPELASQLVGGSSETLKWMTSHGVRFAPAYGRQVFRQGDRFRFWGGADPRGGRGRLGPGPRHPGCWREDGRPRSSRWLEARFR
jgi:tricarballylate dehydrogenase